MTNYIRKIAIAALGLMTYGNAAGQISRNNMKLQESLHLKMCLGLMAMPCVLMAIRVI